MPNYIMKLWLKMINRDEKQLNLVELDILNRWFKIATPQEIAYYYKLMYKIF